MVEIGRIGRECGCWWKHFKILRQDLAATAAAFTVLDRVEQDSKPLLVRATRRIPPPARR